MNSRCRCAVRGASAVLLALLLAAALDARPRAPGAHPPVPTFPVAAQPPKKEPDKKDPDKKEPTRPPEIKWPTDINGKDIAAVMKEMEDPDPTIREFAVRTLPLFGPAAQKAPVSKLLVRRMAVEKDPGVKASVYSTVGQIPFDVDTDNREALRLLATAVDSGLPGSISRLHAAQTIAAFGPKGEVTITALTGTAITDPAYETRRSIANTLGAVGFNERTGPNMKALTALADRLASDPSAAVRVEALQGLMRLGPPWAEIRKPDDKAPPKIDTKSTDVIIKYMRLRVGDPRVKPPLPPLERDKQVEIWARLVLMRFDPKEVNEDNLEAFARYLTGSEPAVKVQALNAMGILGELAAKKLPDVIRVLEEKGGSAQQIAACVQVLMAMKAAAKPALPNLRKMLDEKKKELEAKKLELVKKKDDPDLTAEKLDLEGLVKLLEAAIKLIDEAKPTSPAADPKADPKKP
jgi:HEAT repeat protein